MTTPQNTVFIFSDEHNRNLAGCYGHPFVRTPNLDALAARGTRFTSAYCNSPICVPARASLATGLTVNRHRCWENAQPYHGQIRSWHHVLRETGHEVVSIGKLHFRSSDDDNGFTEELLPMHVVKGKGDLKMLLRKDPPERTGLDAIARTAGPGTSDYFTFDRRIAATAVDWIAGADNDGKPWALFVSFVMPHFPLIVEPEYYDLYAGLDLETLRQGFDAPLPDHPVVRDIRSLARYDDFFDDERRAVALRAYFGMVTALDDNIGTVLRALEAAGVADTTRVIYSSDHGDNLGSRAMWGKHMLYDDSAAVPLIAAGEGFAAGATEATPVSLVDLFPTLAEAAGEKAAVPDGLDGASLFDIVQHPDPERAVLCENHAAYTRTGHFMLRKGRWKLCYYVGGPPQLFDMEADPGELNDLASDPAHAGMLAEMEAALRAIVDPEAADAMAHADQAAMVEANGGREAVLAGHNVPHTPVPA